MVEATLAYTVSSSFVLLAWGKDEAVNQRSSILACPVLYRTLIALLRAGSQFLVSVHTSSLRDLLPGVYAPCL